MSYNVCWQSQYRFLHEVVVERLASHDSYVVKDDLKHGSQWKLEGEFDDQLPAAVRQKSAGQFQVLCLQSTDGIMQVTERLLN